MPIDDKWRKLIPEQIQNLPDYPGVFEFTDILQENVLFIGYAESLIQAILQIVEKKPLEYAGITFFRFKATNEYNNELKQLLDEFQQKYNKLPVINEKLKS
ncbi:hypothetical protein A2Y85_00385 [candidate division WOR-3 bacterium RBG_13_43_14]|uniref:DUF7508 domain-containing protein n=1 Tax=candidate division WOR-3 bacterium RBG_13_43_14 TaxID=1802590 RepID=A0A1F4U399_UNCW3|nr:MAG: hypothetical protein A2Y85_00385 [candidate division WOR-3 bacterium RBG_13_43_14]